MPPQDRNRRIRELREDSTAEEVSEGSPSPLPWGGGAFLIWDFFEPASSEWRILQVFLTGIGELMMNP